MSEDTCFKCEKGFGDHNGLNVPFRDPSGNYWHWQCRVEELDKRIDDREAEMDVLVDGIASIRKRLAVALGFGPRPVPWDDLIDTAAKLNRDAVEQAVKEAAVDDNEED